MQVGEISEINEFVQEMSQIFVKNSHKLLFKLKANINHSDDSFLGDTENQISSEVIEEDFQNIDDLLGNLGKVEETVALDLSFV